MNPEFLAVLSRFFTILGWITLPLLLIPVLTLISPKVFKAFSFSLIEIIDTLSFRLGELVKWSLLIMVLVIVFEVIALTVFGQSWTKISEVAIYCNVIIVLLGSATTLLAGQHVRVDIFHAKMAPKNKARVEILGFYIFLMPVCLILLYTSLDGVGFAWRSLEGSKETDGIRGVFLLRTLIPVFAIMMLSQALSIALRGAFVLRDLPRPGRPDKVDPLYGPSHLEPGL